MDIVACLKMPTYIKYACTAVCNSYCHLIKPSGKVRLKRHGIWPNIMLYATMILLCMAIITKYKATLQANHHDHAEILSDKIVFE